MNVGNYTDSQIRKLVPNGTLIMIVPVGKEIQAIRSDTGEDITNMIRRWTRKQALDSGCGLKMHHTKTNGIQWRKVAKELCDSEQRVNAPIQNNAIVAATISSGSWAPLSKEDRRKFITKSVDYKPKRLCIEDIWWKYTIRASLNGDNLLFVGPSGCGKTLACQCVAEVFPDRKWFAFNLGASQDPRGMLIGNTHYAKDKGTYHAQSLFVQAIQTPGAVILLDEITRAHDDASNILMSVLDANQRYLRIDERPDTPTISVAEGVVFLSTANVGNEYTGTRIMDRALMDRFLIVEMKPLNKTDEFNLLREKFPEAKESFLTAIADIADITRKDIESENPTVSTIISTRMTVKMAELLDDGFTLAEAAETCIYPFFSPSGGTDSERTFMRQTVQKHLPVEKEKIKEPTPVDADDDNLDTSPSSTTNKVPWATT